MTVRNSQIAKHADNSLAVSGKYSRPSLLVQESKRGVNHKRHGDAVNVVERKSARPPRSSAAARTLEEDIFDLIQCEIVRVATQRASMQRASVMKDCGETIVAQMGAASFSNSLDAFGCLMRHRNISQPDRRFLMYTIQAVGFVLGMRTASCGRSDRVRRRAKQVAEILAQAIEQHDPPPRDPQFWSSSLLPV